MNLAFKDAPKDLMTKFVDVLVRLPNPRALQLLSITHRSPVTRGLKRKCSRFPSIREMTICSKYPDFTRSCPNLESLTFRYGTVDDDSAAVRSYGAELKRVGGVHVYRASSVECDSRNCLLIEDSHPMGLS